MAAGSGPYDRFRVMATTRPTEVALRYLDVTLSYDELFFRSEALASMIYARARSTLGLARVGAYISCCPEAVLAILAASRLGLTLVPLDPAWPERRIRHIVSEADLSLVLVSSRLALGGEVAGIPTLCVEDSYSLSVAPAPVLLFSPETPATILFTSGTTGTPKGVVRRAQSIAARLSWATLEPDDVLCHNMSLSIGFSQERLWLPLIRGLPLAVIADEDAARPDTLVLQLARLRVTQLTLSPHVLRLLLALGPRISESLTALRSICVGGAPLTPDTVNAFRKALPKVRLFNHYGSTESGTALRGEVNLDSVRATVPLGRPVAGAEVFILDDALRPCVDGGEGQIAVAGPSVAREYLNSPGLTRSRFVPCPFDRTVGTLYLTGDRGRLLPTGEIEFLGRRDRQANIRGFRVELKEVEGALMHHPLVGEAYVDVYDRQSDARLVAYVVLHDGVSLSADALRAHLETHLPAFMIPHSIRPMRSLPRTLAGKIDPSQLPPPIADRTALDTRYVQPDGVLESLIAQLWETQLGSYGVGREDTFAALGGDSLALQQMLIRLESLLSIELSLARTPTPLTVATFAKYLAPLIGTRYSLDRPTLDTIPRDKPLPLSFLQEARLTAEFLCNIHNTPFDQGRTGLFVKIHGRLDTSALARAFDTVIERHEVLRTSYVVEATVGGLTFRGRTSMRPEYFRRPLRAHFDFAATAVPRVDFTLETVDLAHLETAAQSREVQRLSGMLAHHVFDYERAPLMRAAVLSRSKYEHELFVAISHIVADGWSLEILHRELATLYDTYSRKARCPLEPLPFQFADVAAWQRRFLTGEHLKTLTSYWEVQYRYYRPVCVHEIAKTLAPVPPATLRAEHQVRTIDNRLVIESRVFARNADVTLFAHMFAVFSLLVALHTGREEFGIMTFASNRTSAELQDVVGWFAGLQMIGVHVDPNASFRSLLAQVQHQLHKAVLYQSLPTPLLSRHLQMVGVRVPMDSPPIAFEMRQYRQAISLSSAVFDRHPFPFRREMEGGMRVFVTDRGDDVSLSVLYRADSLSAAQASQLLSQFLELLRRVTNSPEGTLKEFGDLAEL